MGTSKANRLTYATGHPAYLELVLQTIKSRVPYDYLIYLDGDDDRGFDQHFLTEYPFPRLIVIRKPDPEKAYNFIRNVWRSQQFKDTYVLFLSDGSLDETLVVELLQKKAKGNLLKLDKLSASELKELPKLLLNLPAIVSDRLSEELSTANPVQVSQTFRLLSLDSNISPNQVPTILYPDTSEDFVESLWDRDFVIAWKMIENSDPKQQSQWIYEVYRHFKALRYVRREKPRLGWKQTYEGYSHNLVELTYDRVPMYPEPSMEQAESALLSAFSFLPRYPYKAIAMLTCKWPN